MKTAHQNAFAHDVAVDRFENIGSACIRSEIQFSVESEQLKRIVMMRSLGGRAWPHIADASAKVLGLNRAVGHACVGRYPFRQSLSSPGNIEDHPMQNVV